MQLLFVLRERNTGKGRAKVTMSNKGGNERPTWQTPVLIEEEIADLTQNTAARPGDDGFDRFGGYYLTTGPS